MDGGGWRVTEMDTTEGLMLCVCTQLLGQV